jgi:DNA-binding MarR family transcriptional regulator
MPQHEGRVHRAIETLGRLAELFRQRREQLAAGAGLTDQQWQVLEEISTDHFMPTMFAQKRDSSAAAVSKIIRQLVDKGFVTVRVASGDARHRDYALTARGRRVIETLRESRADAIEHVWLPFTPAELDGFIEFGDVLSARLTSLVERYEASTKVSGAVRKSMPPTRASTPPKKDESPERTADAARRPSGKE